MPDSTFSSFDLPIPVVDEDGQLSTEMAAGVTVKVWNVTADAALADTFVSDAQGHVATGTLPVAAGTVVRFRVENDGHGRSGFTDDMVTV
jgi:hypothetical protein